MSGSIPYSPTSPTVNIAESVNIESSVNPIFIFLSAYDPMVMTEEGSIIIIIIIIFMTKRSQGGC
jgi:hypothetical protein